MQAICPYVNQPEQVNCCVPTCSAGSSRVVCEVAGTGNVDGEVCCGAVKLHRHVAVRSVSAVPARRTVTRRYRQPVNTTVLASWQPQTTHNVDISQVMYVKSTNYHTNGSINKVHC